MMQPVILVGSPEAEQRRRAVMDALAFLDRELGGRWRGRKLAFEAVGAHARPMTRARQIVDFERRRRLFGEPVVAVLAPVRSKVRRSKLRRAQLEAEGKDSKTVDCLGVCYAWRAGQVDTQPPDADMSDIEELIVRLVGANVRCPLHGNMVRRLAREVAAGGMGRGAFEARAAQIVLLPSAVPDWVFPR